MDISFIRFVKYFLSQATCFLPLVSFLNIIYDQSKRPLLCDVSIHFIGYDTFETSFSLWETHPYFFKVIQRFSVLLLWDISTFWKYWSDSYLSEQFESIIEEIINIKCAIFSEALSSRKYFSSINRNYIQLFFNTTILILT